MAKKNVLAIVKIQIPAGAATPAPPVGTALGPHGVAIMDFCKAYNERTEDQRGTIIPVEITIFEDRSFTFVTKTPPTSVLLRTAAGLEKAAENPGREEVGLDHRRPADRDRGDQAPRPHRQRPRLGQEDRGRHRPVHGDQDALGVLVLRYRPAGGPRPGRIPSTPHEGAIMAKGKKYQDAARRFDRQRQHTPAEALALVKSLASAKFDESVEVAVRLGVDPRKADEMIRGTVALPAGTGRDVRVAVFAAGEAAAAARPRAPTSSVPTTSPPSSRAAPSSSTWPSPRRT